MRKTLLPISVTVTEDGISIDMDNGISIDTSDVHPSKAPSPISVTEDGISIDKSDVQFLKA
eukprot:scaffold126985_cov34-Attheya_sp.AAC.1